MHAFGKVLVPELNMPSSRVRLPLIELVAGSYVRNFSVCLDPGLQAHQCRSWFDSGLGGRVISEISQKISQD